MTTHRRAVLAGAAAASLAGLSSASAAATKAGKAPIAKTRYGKVRGAELDGVEVFKGVR